ncbi:MAG: hypothetical protein GAK31_00944 [Stenotrophomonas maltophilia]|uniref:Uncharacterized protein n=1 Tax=Stenotrophomonas maltophilia TaxID=40324 RepID=A0A7V8FKE8_STEMA|nr:MAG: hypothetical protein GAK31_00944 [Stenotrophomonas maltophilia]
MATVLVQLTGAIALDGRLVSCPAIVEASSEEGDALIARGKARIAPPGSVPSVISPSVEDAKDAEMFRDFPKKTRHTDPL